MRLGAAIADLQLGFLDLRLRFCKRECQHARHRLVAGQERRGEEQEVCGEVPREHHTDADAQPPPESRSDLEVLKRLEVAADAHQLTRTSRAAYAPSMPCRWGSDWKSPASVSSSAGSDALRGARVNAG